MSILSIKKNGRNIGEDSEESTPKQLELPAPKQEGKAVYVKLTPGTDLYRKVFHVAKANDVPMTKAARILMRGGFLGFAKWRQNMTEVNRE